MATNSKVYRRGFLKAASASGAGLALPTIIPSSALGLDGAVAPSERIVVGGIGIGNRGTYDLGCFLQQSDVQFAAVCDIKETRRLAVKKTVDEKHGNANCAMYRDFRELLDRNDGPQLGFDDALLDPMNRFLGQPNLSSKMVAQRMHSSVFRRYALFARSLA